jgi:hypothetical protein
LRGKYPLRLAFAIFLLLAFVWPASAQRTVWECKFDSPDALAKWQPNEDVSDVKLDDGALYCRATGGDPIFILKPLIEFPCNARQAVDIDVRTDRDGSMLLFWTGDTKGPYGGFTGEKVTSFPVRGDMTWRTYRFFPFWQAEGKIIRLRVDPFTGGKFWIRSLRVLEMPSGNGVQRAGTDGWQAMRSVTVDSVPGAVRLRMQAAGGFALAPSFPIDSERDSVVSVRIATASASRAALVFGTDNAPGMNSLFFDLIPDGRPHVYNLDMRSSSAWTGKILAVGLEPGERAGDALRISRFQVGSQASGPADLRVTWLGIEETAPRAERLAHIRAVVTNGGGETAQRVSAALSLPGGVRVKGVPETASRPVPYAHETVFRWPVVFHRSGPAAISVAVKAANAQPVSKRVCAAIGEWTHEYWPALLPPPVPAFGKIPIGVYYFPGWKSAGQWAPITKYPERRPALGWYREGDPNVAEWQIRWAVEHGINFFAFDWYWTQGSRGLEHALVNGFLKAPDHRLMKFCLLWANHNPPNTSSQADCVAAARHWTDSYFRLPEYLRFRGKPVIIIFSLYRFTFDMGTAGVRKALDAMRAEAASVGGIYFVACVGSMGDAREAAREGYDAITAYNWPGLGVPANEKRAPFADLLGAYRRHWDEVTEPGGLPLLVPISGGWDNRPWAGDAALVRSGRTPELFRRHLLDARRYIVDHPDRTIPMAIVEAWNEWGEGSYIEPMQEFGFGYLDAIRSVFGDGRGPHRDFLPDDGGPPAPQVEFLPLTRTRWVFAKEMQGWETGMGTTGPSVVDGALTGRSLNGDPAFFGPPVLLEAERVHTFHIRLRLDPTDGKPFEDMGQLFFTTQTSPESEANSVRFKVLGDGLWHEYTVSVADNKRWRGTVTRLRFDPCTRSDVTMQVSSMELR